MLLANGEKVKEVEKEDCNEEVEECSLEFALNKLLAKLSQDKFEVVENIFLKTQELL
jgi:hypothetical protein